MHRRDRIAIAGGAREAVAARLESHAGNTCGPGMILRNMRVLLFILILMSSIRIHIPIHTLTPTPTPSCPHVAAGVCVLGIG